MSFILKKVKERAKKTFGHDQGEPGDKPGAPAASAGTEPSERERAELSYPPASEQPNEVSQVPSPKSRSTEGMEIGLVPGIRAIEKGKNYSIQLLYEPAVRSKAIVDIVFLHGLTGNAYTTWLHEPTNIHWPSTCLKDRVPDSRIISFGYDADVVGWWHQRSTNRVANHANDMIGALVRLRENSETEDRKIIFVAHSLGGLVTETAIASSRQSPFEHIRQVEKHTVGIIFMGTPHLGADAAKWATFVSRLINAVRQTNINAVEVLKPDSEMLESIQKNFQSVLRQRIDEQDPIEITCFFEQLSMKVIVPKHSAILQPYSSYGIYSNHRDMTKFTGPGDQGFEDVVGEILRPIRRIRRTTQPVSSAQTECLKSLFFDSLESRQERIAPAADNTFQWIWSDKSLKFNEWLKTGYGVLWISGKPGSGKSTLMKFVSESPMLKSRLAPPFWNPNSDPIILTHFFNYEDPDPLARNLEGLLRSLLWQILDQNHKCFNAVLPDYLRLKQNRPNVVWKRSLLSNLLQKVLSEHCSVPVCIFIDALDEYREEYGEEFQKRHSQIAEYLRGLTSAVPKNIRFCLSSRPYPDFQFNFLAWNNLYNRISIDRLNSTDISTYVSAQFEQIVKQDGNCYLKLVDQINAKASDTFLWVKLVSERLVHCWKRGERILRLEKRLSDLPEKLSDLYERILSEMDPEERGEVEVLLGLVAAAARPLDLKELAYASTNFDGQSGLVGLDSSDDMRRRIEGIGGGLLEIRFGQVRFLHGTVLTHLREKHSRVLDAGRKHLLQACLYSLSRISKSWTGEIEGKDKQFLRYAVLNWLSHAKDNAGSTQKPKEKAMAHMTNTEHLLWYELFLASSWQLPSQRRLLTYQFSARRLQLLILFSNLNLALSHPLSIEHVKISDALSTAEQYDSTIHSLIEDTASGFRFLFGIADCRTDRAVYAFLECTEPGLDLFEAVKRYQMSSADSNVVESADFSVLPVAHFGDEIARKLQQPGLIRFDLPTRSIRELDSLEAVAICANTQESVSPVQLAAYHGLYDCLELLIREGADINLEAGSAFGTPLLASICGIIELSNPGFERVESVFTCFEYVLWEGADPNQAAFGANIGGIRTPLEVALHALSARIDAVKSLGRNVVVLEDVPCSNLVYVIDNLLNCGAIPNLVAQKELLRHSQIKVLFKDKVNDILVPGAKAYDDIVVRERKQQKDHEKRERHADIASTTTAVPIRRYSLDASIIASEDLAWRTMPNDRKTDLRLAHNFT